MSTSVSTTTKRTSVTAPLSGGSNRLRSRLPQNEAVAGLRDRMFGEQRVEFLPRNRACEIMQLEGPSTLRDAQGAVTQRTTSPEAFFGQWKIQPGAFTSEDVEELYRMMSSHPMSDRISFYPLFGLEFCDLLGRLDALDKHLSTDLRTKCVRLLQEKYLETFGRLAVYGNGSEVLHADTPAGPVNIFDHYLEQVRERSLEELNQRKNNKSPMAQKLVQKSYEQQVTPVLQDFHKTLKLLQKFLTHPCSFDLLNESLLRDCLGVKQVMPLSNLSEARIAGQNICTFASFLTRCMDSLEPAMPQDLAAFMGPLRKLHNHPFNSAKPLQQSANWSNERTTELWQQSFAMQRLFLHEVHGPIDRRRQGLFNFCLMSVENTLSGFEYTILPWANPIHKLQKAHEKRLVVNWVQYSQAWESLNGPLNEQVTTTKTSQFDSIYREIIGDFKKFSKTSWEAIEARIGIKNRSKEVLPSELPLSRLAVDELKQFSLEINRWTESTLQKLSDYARDHAEEMRNLPILEKTVQLAQAFLIKNDLDMVLYGQTPWAHELPQEYLDLLLLEFVPEPINAPSIEPAPVVVHAPVEAEPTEPPVQEALEIKGPPSVVAATPPSKPKPQKAPVAAPTPNPVPMTDPRDLGFKRGMYADQVLRVLTRLGLKSIPGGNGSHRHVVDGQGNIVTVIKGHGTISPGGLHDVQAKVAGYFEQKSAELPAPSTTRRRKKK